MRTSRAALRESTASALFEGALEGGSAAAGAPLAGLARSIASRLPVPAVDGVSSAVRHAESMAALRPVRAVKDSFAPPPVKPNRGLPEPIERLLAGR